MKLLARQELAAGRSGIPAAMHRPAPRAKREKKTFVHYLYGTLTLPLPRSWEPVLIPPRPV